MKGKCARSYFENGYRHLIKGTNVIFILKVYVVKCEILQNDVGGSTV